MPRQKKEALSPAVGTLSKGSRKSGNPDFVSSSFYVPKGVNNAFNRALLTLKDADFDVDRSDILAVLMDRFATAVEEAERSEDGLDMETLIESAGADAAVTDTAGLNSLKEVHKQHIEELKRLKEEQDRLSAEKDSIHKRHINLLLELIPDTDLKKQLLKLDEMTDEQLEELQRKGG